MNYNQQNMALQENGYAIIDNLYTNNEVNLLISCIENKQQNGDSFLKTKNLFAIRQLLKNIPELVTLIFNQKLNELLFQHFKTKYFLTKAIYFDKPSVSNWFVAYHQDLSISVNEKMETSGYINWTFKKGQYGVQPPLNILKDTITVRIHLDDTSKDNGALKVIPKSHSKGIIRIDSNKINTDNEFICEVNKGGIMLMKPLTLHASNKTTNKKRRRVIHLEFNKHQLTKPLHWLEYLDI